MAPGVKGALSALQPKKIAQKRVIDVAKNSNIPVIELNHDFQSLGTHCLRYISPQLKSIIESETKVAVGGFDLDDTLVKTKSGGKFPRTADDWKWWHSSVPEILESWTQEKEEGDSSRIIVIFTNQGGVTNTIPTTGPNKPSVSFAKLHSRLHQVISSPKLSKLPVAVYASTKKSKAKTSNSNESPDELHSQYRKPGPGMWNQMTRDLHPCTIVREKCVYVGDAAGRKGDFSDSDKKFAESLDVKFQTPEEFFGV